ncbi:MAG: ABC transporter substrate-binding protein [Gammaproteobacteria bacterium]|nr:ABC transporter substrate-binding protein [Gammaproteobacteria bacterium]
MKRLGILLTFILGFAAGVAHAAPAPNQLVRERTDKIISLLKANKDTYAKDHKKLYAMVQEQVLPYFDFRAMSRLVLGRHWREANEDQRNRFANEFRDLLVRTYATALLKYTNEEVVYLSFRMSAEEKTVVVKTEVRQGSGGPTIPINYSFYLTDNVWKVFDVAIDGISLVTTYRSTYAEKIKNEGLDALIATMAKRDKDDTINKARGQKAGSK